MLTDAEYALMRSVPDVTNLVDSREMLYEAGADQFRDDEYKAGTWKRAWDHADMLNERHYEDCLSFCVIRYCQDYYVLDKVIARKLNFIA